jgi:hypothetical protein
MCLLPVPPALLFTLLSDKKITLFLMSVKWVICISGITIVNTRSDPAFQILEVELLQISPCILYGSDLAQVVYY